MNIQKMQKTQVKCRKVRGEDKEPHGSWGMGISAGLCHWTGARKPGLKSQLCHLLLCDCGQVSSPLWGLSFLMCIMDITTHPYLKKQLHEVLGPLKAAWHVISAM